MELKDFWAKTQPFQSVLTHGKISGQVARVLWNDYLPDGCRRQLCEELGWARKKTGNLICYLVSVHDIGKLGCRFQRQDAETESKMKACGMVPAYVSIQTVRHERTTDFVMRRIWENAGCDKRKFGPFAKILSAHHQGKVGACEESSRVWQDYQNEYEQLMRDAFWEGVLDFPEIRRECQCVPEALILAVVILSDWIASGTLFQDGENWGVDLLAETERRTHLFLRQSGLAAEKIAYGKAFSEVWPNIRKGCERQLQLETEKLFSASKQRHLLVLLEAPMGEGKTEAGVYAAVQMAEQWDKHGFYIGLPTAATANQMAARMQGFLKLHGYAEQVKLMHSMAWMLDEGNTESFGTEEEQFIRRWLMPMRRGMLAPYAVGTADQALMAALFVKYGVLRLLGLSCKALVIDEVHAYDLYMTKIMDRLLAWCKAMETPVVLLSATLPPEKKRELIGIYTDAEPADAYPAVTAVSASGEIQVNAFDRVAKHQVFQTETERILHQPDRIARLAKEKVSGGGCCCVLLNTVRQAQELYRRLHGFEGTLLLFHAQFPAEQRGIIEQQCIRLFGKGSPDRPSKAILVATQVVEQSLDVDFDCMMTAIAPIDLLLQRMGRMFRHENTVRPETISKPVLTILAPEEGGYASDGYVYPPCLLKRAEHLLETRREIRVPEDMAALVQDGYSADGISEAEMREWMEHLVDDSVKSSEAEKYLLPAPDQNKMFPALHLSADFDDLEEQSYLSAKTRLSEPTVRLALLEDGMLAQVQAHMKNGIADVRDRQLAQAVLGQSVSVSKKKYEAHLRKYGSLDIPCGSLLAGVRVLPKENPAVAFDLELGLLWREEIM